MSSNKIKWLRRAPGAIGVLWNLASKKPVEAGVDENALISFLSFCDKAYANGGDIKAHDN
jgi:hypothetical protein